MSESLSDLHDCKASKLKRPIATPRVHCPESESTLSVIIESWGVDCIDITILGGDTRYRYLLSMSAGLLGCFVTRYELTRSAVWGFVFSAIFAVLPVSADDEWLPTLVEKIKPSVVTVHVRDAAGKPLGQGTGWFLDHDEIVTNYHVIKNAASASVKLSTGASLEIKGVVATNREQDLAILQVAKDAFKGPLLRLAPKPASVGETVVVIGTPQGLELSVSTGIVSSVRKLNDSLSVIQMTAAISPGSSGSPVLSREGRVVGVATFQMVKGQQLNFGVPAAMVRGIKRHPLRTMRQFTELDSRAEKRERDAVTDALEKALDNVLKAQYEAWADAWLDQKRRQGGLTPELVLNDLKTSIGRVRGRFRILQILDNSTALLTALDSRGRIDFNLRVRGVDLARHANGGIVEFEHDLIFAREQSYSYQTVRGVRNTVRSITTVDRDRLDGAIKVRRAALGVIYTKEIEKWRTSLVHATTVRDKAVAALNEFLLENERVPEYQRLMKQYRLYEPASSNPNIRKKLERIVKELEVLGDVSEAEIHDFNRDRGTLELARDGAQAHFDSIMKDKPQRP